MRKYLYILTVALGLCGCASSKAPLDDAYYWPDGAQEQHATQPVNVTEKAGTAPTMEYVSVKDTTVTVKIKR